MMNKLQLLHASEKVPFLGKVIRGQGDDNSPIAILEAGCGQRWLVRLDGKKYFLTGIDLDKDALEIRKNVRKDLHEAIHGDLRTISFNDRRFDVIYSAFVLEHIHGAEDVLTRMTTWLKTGGIIVIEVPDPDSVKGLITRISPHWFHVFYYRYILGIKTAGAPGHGPYRTYFDPVVSRRGIYEFAARNNLSVEAEYAFATDGPRNKAMRALVGLSARIVSLVTFGKFPHNHADLLYVLRRQA